MEKVYKFEFTFQEVIVLMKGCEELPYKVSSKVRDKIIKQYDEQVVIDESKQAKADLKVEE